MPKSKSKRKKVLATERAQSTRQHGARQALREIRRLVNLPETVLADWPEDLWPVLEHACREFSDGRPVIHRDGDGCPVVIAANPDGPGWVALDDIRDGQWRLRMFAVA